ncbi:DUF523 and DUF1722 domain-containing protein [Candidatus Thioglobus sp.]|jgi:uncharacterized protein YbgA (DUF1722 family)/uncharacterized protein YbbK (DUF523 family)|nr:DUF523 and DUF1722 domain-containing protein [Candidatus Thioglobus sp.]
MENFDNNKTKPNIGISACLMGHKVRFDGSHKNNKFVNEVANHYFNPVTVCPEVGAGMGTPRPPIHLYNSNQGILLVDRDDHAIDYSEPMHEFAQQESLLLADQLNGFIFKSKSPSCGIERVPIYQDGNKMPDYSGIGAFTQIFTQVNPNIPIEDEGRLNDSKIKENFLERVYAHYRFSMTEKTVSDLLDFHASYKYSIMARGSQYPSILGRIAASARHDNIEETREVYFKEFMQIMKIQASRSKHVNTMQHIMGYFKNELDADSKQELLSVFDSYKNYEVPLSTPMALLNLFQRRYKNNYLSTQYYLNPYPKELALRANI